MTRVYPQDFSVVQGTSLHLCVSTDRPQFRVDIYRQGAGLQLMQSVGWQTGSNLGDGPADQDWGWPSIEIPIPNGWPSGAYIAVVTEGDGHDNDTNQPDATTADGSDSNALFIVKASAPGQKASILYKLSLFTYQAYNEPVGNGSFYTGAKKVTFRRPGGGTGATPWDSIYSDEYDTTTFRQTFAHWDVYFIKWLENNGFQVEYCSDLDIHFNTNDFVSNYRLILSVGHDEYWSPELRQNMETFISEGGNVAFFSANTCWWRVHVEDNGTAISVDKSLHDGDTVLFDKWYRTNPENAITGVSYRNGAGKWDGQRGPVGYTVQYAGHWIYEGTGVKDGDVFGNTENLVGYECDGAVTVDGPGGYKIATGADMTPANFIVLGYGELGAEWHDPDDAFDPSHPKSQYQATMGLYSNGGTVFTGATVDWARVLGSGRSRIVERITANILNRLSVPPLKVSMRGANICGRLFAVEGQKITFSVDIDPLPNKNGLQYKWEISDGGVAQVFDQPSFQAQMPSPPKPVTITVTITDAGGLKSFGSRTVIPISIDDERIRELLCLIYNMDRRLSIAITGIGEGFGVFVDPLFDPPPYKELSIKAADVRLLLDYNRKIQDQLLRLLGEKTENTRHT